MTDENEPYEDPLATGAKGISEWKARFVVLDEVPAGSVQIAALYESSVGHEIEELSTILSDLSFAHNCLLEADKLGLPDPNNLHSRALINAAVVSYARVFKGGVRQVRVDVHRLLAELTDVDTSLHDFLLNLRDKHVAHSVNEFERAAAGPLMIQPPLGQWSPRGVGCIVQLSIGLNRQAVLAAISLIKALMSKLEAQIRNLEDVAFQTFVAAFAKTKQFTPAPLYTAIDQGKVGIRRPKPT